MGGIHGYCVVVLLSVVALALVPGAMPLQSLQTWSLLKLQQLLGSWRNYTDFCYGGDYRAERSFLVTCRWVQVLKTI